MSKKKKRRAGLEKAAASEPAAVPVAPQAGGKRGWIVPLALVLLVGAINFITMPSMFYPGDNFAVRMETANWLMTGNLGIDYSHREEMRGFTEVRGQYLYENDTRRKFFSKYGLGCTLQYLPPCLWQKWTVGGDLNVANDSLLFKINVWQVVLSMILAFYLFKTARFFTRSDWMASAFVLLSIYCTFAWHYVRSPTIEILQMAPFAASTYHMLAFARRKREFASSARSENAPATRAPLGPWFHLAAASLWGGFLVLTKLLFVVHMGLIVAVAVTAGNRRSWAPSVIVADLRRNAIRYGVFMLTPMALFAAAVLWSNWYRFESILNTGYGQWMSSPGEMHDRFSPVFAPRNLKGMFVTLNEYNVFIAFPIVAFGLFGLRTFVRRYGSDSVVLLAVVVANLVPNAMYNCWPGSWCYGPRYQIQMLFVMALPFLCVLEWTAKRIRTVAGVGAASFMTVVLAVSLYLQVQVNSLHYFAQTYAGSMFDQFKIPAMRELTGSWSWSFHLGIRHADLKAYIAGKRAYAPLEIVKRVAPPEQWPQLKAQIDANLRQIAKPNFYFFP